MEKISNEIGDIFSLSSFDLFDSRLVHESMAERFNNMKVDSNHYECEICKNKGYIEKVRVDENNKVFENYLVKCECNEIRKCIGLMEKNGYNRFNLRFNDFDCKEQWQLNMKNTAIDYCQNAKNEWFVLLGQSGCGKTLISSIVTNYQIYKLEKDTLYVSYVNFINLIKRYAVNDVESLNLLLDETKKCSVLFIDDLFKSFSNADLKYVYDLIDYRYMNDLKTIITSEKSINELMVIDEAIGGRIVERASRYLISIEKDKSKNQRMFGGKNK